MMSSERREYKRYAVWFPVHVETPEIGSALAVSYDVSRAGLRISSAAKFEIGMAVTLSFRIPPDSKDEKHAEGRIIRMDPNLDDPEGFWPYRFAIEFTHVIPELESILKAVEVEGH